MRDCESGARGSLCPCGAAVREVRRHLYGDVAVARRAVCACVNSVRAALGRCAVRTTGSASVCGAQR